MAVITYKIFLSDGTSENIDLEHVRIYIENSFKTVHSRKIKIKRISVWCECSESFPISLNKEECEYLRMVLKHYINYLNSVLKKLNSENFDEDIVFDIDEKTNQFMVNLTMKLSIINKFNQKNLRKVKNRC